MFPTHRAKIQVGLHQLVDLLDLPNDVQILYAYASNDPAGLTVVLKGDRFAQVPVDTECPYVDGHLSSESVIVDGKKYSRLIAWGAD